MKITVGRDRRLTDRVNCETASPRGTDDDSLLGRVRNANAISMVGCEACFAAICCVRTRRPFGRKHESQERTVQNMSAYQIPNYTRECSVCVAWTRYKKLNVPELTTCYLQKPIRHSRSASERYQVLGGKAAKWIRGN